MKDLSKFIFFEKPCFVCINMNWESGEGEYGTGGSYAICTADDDIYEVWQEDKKEFPYCDCPKRCIRKNIFAFNSNFDREKECDYYSILSTMTNFNKTHDTAYNIALSISNFNARLRQHTINK